MLDILTCLHIIGKLKTYQIRYHNESACSVSTNTEYISRVLKIKPAKYRYILKKYHAKYNDFIGYYFDELEDAQNCLNYLNDTLVITAKLLGDD